MNAPRNAELSRGILRAMEVSPVLSRADLNESDRHLINQIACAAPETLDRQGRRIPSVALAIQTEFEIDPADTVVRIRDLIDRGILFQHHTNPTISFRRFPSKQSNPGRCVYCGRNSNRITKDHVIPRSQGGSDQASNIVQACPSCNQAKGNRTPQQWAADILKFRQPAKVTPLRWLDRIRLMALVVRNFVQRGESC